MNILLADDPNMVRNGITLLLEFEKKFTVVGEALDEGQILEKVIRREVELILIDPESPVMDGVALVKKIKEYDSEVKVVMLTSLDSRESVLSAFRAGADGYMLKKANPDELLFALRHVKDGGKYICSELSMKFLYQQFLDINNHDFSKARTIEFSLRETEILQLIAEGLTNSEMSEKLFISKRTIEGHRQSLLEKTGSKNTASLIRFAVRNQLVQ